jgi:hypothetical protein
MSAGELVNVDGIEVIESNIEKDEVEREAAEKLAEVKELSTRHDIYDLLTQSIGSVRTLFFASCSLSLTVQFSIWNLGNG